MVMGVSVSGSKSSTQSQSETKPWEEQIPWITKGWETAGGLLDRGPYGGPWWLGPNEMQQSAIGGGYGGTGQAQAIAGQMTGWGNQLSGGLGTAMDFYQKQLQGAGIANPYGGDRYQQMIRDNAWTDIDQQQLDLQMGAIGDMQAMQDRDNRLRASVAGVSGGSDALRGYAANALGAQRMAGEVANRIGRAGLDRATGMANQWAGQQVAGQMADRAMRTGAAGSLAGMGGQGLDYLSQAYGMGQQGWQDAARWGDYQRGFDLEEMQGRMAEYNSPWDMLNNYWNIVGSNNWGSQTKSSSSTTSVGAQGGYKAG